MAVALCLFGAFDAESKTARSSERVSSPRNEKVKTPSLKIERGQAIENYLDLIQKAQNLTLQQDRLQASQVLIRGIQNEERGSVAHKELVRALDDLTSVFYTEKTQSLFSAAESLAVTKPREALEGYQEALKADDRNVLMLKSIARAYLRVDECDKAEVRVKAAEDLNPYSAEVKLLRLQVLACNKSYDELATRIQAKDVEMEPVEKFLKGLQMLELTNRKESKRAKAVLASWESQAPDYPEVHFWKWQISQLAGSADRMSAAKYVQLCQNMSVRKRKASAPDVELCKAVDTAEIFLREKESLPATNSSERTGVNR